MALDLKVGPLELVTAPTTYPVLEEEVKAQCRIDFDDDNVLLGRLIAGATAAVEKWIDGRRAVMTQTWDLPVGGWWDELEIPLPPLQSVTSVQYYDEDNTLQTLAAADYLVRTPRDLPGVVEMFSSTVVPILSVERWFPIKVRFVAGYGTVPTAVPATIRQAVLITVTSWYLNPEAYISSGAVPQQVPLAVADLLAAEGWGSYT